MAEEIIRKVIENLEKNNIKGYYCKSKKDALSLVEELIPKGATVSNGGSQTLKETKIMDLLKSGKYNFLDRSVPGMTREDVEKVYREAYTADCYLASCNAVTEDGYLYNVDENSNRVSAIL
ncbi:MAG: lactate utilization protein, partial [Acutalibacteraceae bacterium]